MKSNVVKTKTTRISLSSFELAKMFGLQFERGLDKIKIIGKGSIIDLYREDQDIEFIITQQEAEDV